jgi:histidinol-phosphate aminotransferase
MPTSGILGLLRPELSEFDAYVPEPGDYPVRLDANEAPPLLSSDARARLADAVAKMSWERYPDAKLAALKAAIAARCAVSPSEVIAGVGSDELIAILLTAFTHPRSGDTTATVLTTTPTFVMYRMTARIRGLRVIEVPLDAGWDLPMAALERAVSMSAPHVVLIASPNNPTANAMSYDRLEQFIQLAKDSLVVIDEAYVDYADHDCLSLYRKYENVAVLRTLSKIGFAALRVGWLLARPEIVAQLDKVRLPYNLPALSQQLATIALTELQSEVQDTIALVVRERQRVFQALVDGGRVAPSGSDANFLWVRTERPAGEVFEGLRERGILVRSFHRRGGRLAHQLRITIGTEADNDRLLKALHEVA